MGCRWEILLHGDDPVRLRAAGQEALREVERLDARLSLFDPASVVSDVNARASREPVPVDPEFLYLLGLCRSLTEATEGAFDVTVGPLLECWGFRGERERPPTPEQVEAARASTGMAGVEVDSEAGTVRFLRPGMAIDLGAVGKGYALERAAEVLQDLGIHSALLHAGTSSIYALGAPPGEDAWAVAIRHPLEPNRHVAVKHLRDTGFAVSAPHGRMLEFGGESYGHVLDPRSGRPVEGQLLAAVTHPSPSIADALSTALLVRGEVLLGALQARWPELDALVLTRGEGVVE